MLTKILLIFFVFATCLKGLGQTLVLAPEDSVQIALMKLPDSSFHKLVEKMYLQFFRGKGPGGQQITIDIMPPNNKLIVLPETLKVENYNNIIFIVDFKGFLYEYFHSGNEEMLSDFNISENEKSLLQWLKTLGMGTVKKSQMVREQRTIKNGDGTEQIQYVEVEKEVTANYYDAPAYSIISCSVSYEPSGADVYVVPRREWIETFKLADPPDEKEININVLRKLSYFKINKVENPLRIELNEKTYVVLFNLGGKLSFKYLLPSTAFKERNIISAKLK